MGNKKPSKSAEPRERVRKMYEFKQKELPRSFYTEIIVKRFWFIPKKKILNQMHYANKQDEEE